MKHLTTTKENGWIWPATGEYTWNVVSAALELHTAIKPLLKQTNVAIQAGGNGGLMVQPLAETFKHIYTFEPEPLNFYCLVQNITSINVHKFQACLGDEPSTINLDTIDKNDNGAFFVSGFGAIPVLRIDNLGLSECDLIQLDIEGHEYLALLGGINTIKKFKPLIVIECFEPWMHRYNVTIDLIEKLLIQDLGYTYNSTCHGDRIYTHP